MEVFDFSQWDLNLVGSGLYEGGGIHQRKTLLGNAAEKHREICDEMQ